MSHSAEAISLAPYLMWLGSMSIVALMCLRRQAWPNWIASTAFLWGFVGASGDIANACFGWIADRGGHNDLASALGPAKSVDVVLFALAAAFAVAAGYVIQMRLYRTSLRLAAYGLLVGALGLVAGLLMLVM